MSLKALASLSQVPPSTPYRMLTVGVIELNILPAGQGVLVRDPTLSTRNNTEHEGGRRSSFIRLETDPATKTFVMPLQIVNN